MNYFLYGAIRMSKPIIGIMLSFISIGFFTPSYAGEAAKTTTSPAASSIKAQTITQEKKAVVDDKNNTEVKTTYTPTEYYGEPVYGPDHKLLYVMENKSQTHPRTNFVKVRVTGIKKNTAARNIGRIRIAVWNNETKANYGKEGTRPFRASSHWAKDVVDDSMVFHIGGLVVGEYYSFFGQFDEKNTGTVRRFLGIPQDQYIFSSAENPEKGLSREGFGPPSYEKTLIKFTGSGQEVILPLH